MQKNIISLLKILIYSTFFVPLVVIPSSFIFPFIVPKILLFRSLVTVMLGAYLLLLAINWREFKPKQTPVTFALLAFLLSFALSTFAGVDSYHSFWDNHERMLGLFTIFHYVAFFFVAGEVFKNWTDWKLALKVFLIAGSGVMALGVMQVADSNFLLNQGSDRVASTLGNAIYVGGYGLFLTFVAFLLYIKEKDQLWRYIEIACGILAVLGMFYSGTRGSMLGLLFGILTAMAGYLITMRGYKKVRIGLGVAAAAVCAIVGILYAFRYTNFVSNLPAIGRAMHTTFSDIENSPRWIAWHIAYDSWKEKPVFGWGPNNFFYAFNKHYNPKSLNYGYGETWFDNAHNIIMNTLAVQGAFGVLTYLGIFAASIYCLVVAKKRGLVDAHIAVVGCAFLVAHLVQNITVFENPTSYLYFMFWLAMVSSLVVKQEQQTPSDLSAASGKKPSINKPLSSGLIIADVLVVLSLVFIFNIQPARANMKTLDALKAISQDPAGSVEVIKEALAFNSPHVDDIRNDTSRTIASVVGNPQAPVSANVRSELIKIGIDAETKNLTLHPLDIRVHLMLAQLYQIQAETEKNGTYILMAQQFLEAALQYSPRRQQLLYSLAAMDMQIGQGEKAEQLLLQAVADNPKVGESYWRLAYLYKGLMHNQAKAQETVASARKNGVVFSSQEEQVINQILSATSTP